ncbi:MAG: sel1 repeat family protein [Nitrosomonadales bacterium]|nr:sel1 repeat family protein [Nitrosomonadales bacterium]
MNRLQKRVLLVCVCIFALAGQTMADPLSDANSVYETGDYEKAAKLYTPLAQSGSAEAQYVLGMMYRAGRGVPHDYNEARKWYMLAAEQGHPIAQFYLGWIYVKGKGVPKDNIRGYMWLNIAIANASSEAKREFIVDRDSIAAAMTADQIGKAQELTKKCTAKKFKGC